MNTLELIQKLVDAMVVNPSLATQQVKIEHKVNCSAKELVNDSFTINIDDTEVRTTGTVSRIILQVELDS